MNRAQANKTHCPHGHLYGGDNLILLVVRDRDGNDTGKRKRQCRQCKRDSRKPKSVPATREALRAASEA